MPEPPHEKYKKEIAADLIQSISPEGQGKVDFAQLRSNNPPLAVVLDAFLEGKTERDDASSIFKDLSRVLEARDPTSRLAQALEKLEAQLQQGSEEK